MSKAGSFKCEVKNHILPLYLRAILAGVICASVGAVFLEIAMLSMATDAVAVDGLSLTDR